MTTNFYKVADATSSEVKTSQVLTAKYGGNCPLYDGAEVKFTGTAAAVQVVENSRFQAALSVKVGGEETLILLATLRRALTCASDGAILKGQGDCSAVIQTLGLSAEEVAEKLDGKKAVVSVTEAMVTKTRFADGVSYNTLGRVYNLSFK